MDAEKSDKTLEEAFEQLDSIVKELEKEQVSLEDSFQMYKEGMELLQYCNKIIDTVEKKVMLLDENGDISEF